MLSRQYIHQFKDKFCYFVDSEGKRQASHGLWQYPPPLICGNTHNLIFK